MAMNVQQARCHRFTMPRMRKALLPALLLLVSGLSLHAQDVLTLGSEFAPAGGTATIPISLLDRSSTPLGIDQGSSNRVQGIAFKVRYPTELVASVSFTRAGVAAQVTPLFATALQGSGWSSCLIVFHEATNPVPFTLNAPAPGDRIGTLTVVVRGDAPAGSVARLILDPPGAMLSNRTASTRETVRDGNLSLVNGSITVTALQTPSPLVATASGTTSVNVSWTAVPGANHYEVWRSANASAFAVVSSPSGTAFTDSTVSANTTYLYRVRATGGGDTSAFSNIDAATTIVFTDDPLVALTTKVKAVHLTQLRTAVNAMRAAAGLSPLGSDATIAIGLPVRAQHITDLRTALNAARTAIGLPTLTYTDPTPTIIKAVHVQQLRNAVK
jgi:hypothetical protein